MQELEEQKLLSRDESLEIHEAALKDADHNVQKLTVLNQKLEVNLHISSLMCLYWLVGINSITYKDQNICYKYLFFFTSVFSRQGVGFV